MRLATFGDFDPSQVPVDPIGQWVATAAGYGLCVLAVGWVLARWRRDRSPIPAIILFGGTVTFLLEPMYDRLYGLWFHAEGQWNLYTAYGVHEPIWVPAAYLMFYGVGTLATWRALEDGGGVRAVYRQLVIMFVVVVLLVEVPCINLLGVFEYRGYQPLSFLGYPLHAAMVNAVEPIIAGVLIHRLAPLVTGFARLALAMVIPMTFGAIAFGCGFPYLAVRHSGDAPASLLAWLAALITVALALGAVWLATLLLRLPAAAPADRPEEQRVHGTRR